MALFPLFLTVLLIFASVFKVLLMYYLVSFLLFQLQFISGVMAALSAMVSLEIPQVNIMTKMDLLSPKAKKEIEK